MLRLFGSTVVLVAAASAAMAEPAKRNDVEKAADRGDKIICKRFVETGSLVKGQRTCKPKSEWERDRETARSTMATGAGSCNGSDSGAGC